MILVGPLKNASKRICVICGKSFENTSRNRVSCSDECAKQRSKDTRKKSKPAYVRKVPYIYKKYEKKK